MEDKIERFTQIIETYQEMLYYHVRRMVVSHDDAQDILQDTFVTAYEKIDQLKEIDALKWWLYKIATRKAIKFLKNRYKTEAISENLITKLFDDKYVNINDIAGIELQKALLQLPEKQRTVFNLRYYDEFDYKAIADITSSTPNSVKVLYHYAKERIEEQLKQLLP